MGGHYGTDNIQNVEIALQRLRFGAVWSGVILETFIAGPARRAERQYCLCKQS